MPGPVTTLQTNYKTIEPNFKTQPDNNLNALDAKVSNVADKSLSENKKLSKDDLSTIKKAIELSDKITNKTTARMVLEIANKIAELNNEKQYQLRQAINNLKQLFKDDSAKASLAIEQKGSLAEKTAVASFLVSMLSVILADEGLNYFSKILGENAIPSFSQGLGSKREADHNRFSSMSQLDHTELSQKIEQLQSLSSTPQKADNMFHEILGEESRAKFGS